MRALATPTSVWLPPWFSMLAKGGAAQVADGSSVSIRDLTSFDLAEGWGQQKPPATLVRTAGG
jgi:hypothetical protein